MLIILAKPEMSSDSHLENIIETLAEIKKELKDNPIAHEICDEYGFQIDIIDGIPIEFIEDLDASAKTLDARIQLNTNLLDEDFAIIMRYAIHELVHALQHMRSVEIDPYSDEDYLDRGDELEAFQYQIAFDAENRGRNEAEDYVNDLIEYHEIPEPEQDVKKTELMNKVK